MENQSDIAKFRIQQALNEEASLSGLFGLAYGSAHHAFINRKTENIQRDIAQYTQTMTLEDAWRQVEVYIEQIQILDGQMRAQPHDDST